MSGLIITLTILILITAILLALIVLVQNSKGGGLAAGFQSSNQIMGVRKTTDFLEKATWGLAFVMILLSIVVVGIQSNSKTVVNDSEIKEQAADVNNQMQRNTATPGFGETPAVQQNKQAAPAQQPAQQPDKK